MTLKVKQDDLKFPFSELEAFETEILQKTCNQIMAKLSRLDPKDVLKNSFATSSTLQVTLSGYKATESPVTRQESMNLTSSELVELIKTKNAKILTNKIPSYVNELTAQLKIRLFSKDQGITSALFETLIVPTKFWVTPSGLDFLENGPLSHKDPHTWHYTKPLLDVLHEMSAEQRKTFFKSIEWDTETVKTLKDCLFKFSPETVRESKKASLGNKYQGSLPFSRLDTSLPNQSPLKSLMAASSANPLKVGIQSEEDLAYFENLWYQAVTTPQSWEADVFHLIEKGTVEITNVNEKLVTNAISKVTLPTMISINDILPLDYEPKFENGQLSIIPFPKKAPRKKFFTMERPEKTLFDAPSIKKGQRVILTPDYTVNRAPNRNWDTKDSDLICKFIENYNDPKQLSDGVYGSTHPKTSIGFPQDIGITSLQKDFKTANLSLDPQMSIDKESFYLHQKWEEKEDLWGKDRPWKGYDPYLKEEVEGPYFEEAKTHLPSFIEK